jgi:hypothetical protein
MEVAGNGMALEEMRRDRFGGRRSSPSIPLHWSKSDGGGAMLTVDFGTPSYKFTVNICTYLIFYLMVLTPQRYQVHSRMSILEFVVYAGN